MEAATGRFFGIQERARTAWQSFERPSRPWIGVGIDTSSVVSGARDLLAELRRLAQSTQGVDVVQIGTRGCDFINPAIEVTYRDGQRVLHSANDIPDIPAFVKKVARNELVRDGAIGVVSGAIHDLPSLWEHDWFRLQKRWMTKRCGWGDPDKIEHYIGTGGYATFARCVGGELSGDEVLKQMDEADLWGRSGSAFPAARKWEFLRDALGERKILVCNADEGDPGQWPNRYVMENDPHQMIEGMLIAAYVTGATDGYIYLRDEYPLAHERIEKALSDAHDAGLLGGNILGSGMSFDLELVRGAGSYVCGEESGLIASLEDRRGMPKIRPPYPAQKGVLDHPTNVNNVETYALVPTILELGAREWSSVGSADETGTLLVTLSGNVERSGSMEVPLGTRLGDLLDVTGPAGDRPGMKAIQAGGPLSGLLPFDPDLPLSRAEFRARGVGLGGGGVVFIDDRACIVNLSIAIETFLEDESCGRCTTCFAGTRRLVEILNRISEGRGRMADLELIQLLGRTMVYSNCAHGTAAPTIIINMLAYFRDEVEEHILRKRCPTKVCSSLIRYEVIHDSDRLSLAEDICPTRAVVRTNNSYHIDQEMCVRCAACKEQAPYAIQVVDAY